MNIKMILLSNDFYSKYDAANYPEIMRKDTRPYACFAVKIDNHLFAIPIRHHINHAYAFMTTNDCDLDYSKAVVIDDPTYISSIPAIIDTTEWNIIKTSANTIFFEFRKYVRQYRRALKNPTNPRSAAILRYSTLQYFNLD